LFNKITMTISKEKFRALWNQKAELTKEFPDRPAFIDIKEEKLYIINDDGEKEFVF